MRAKPTTIKSPTPCSRCPLKALNIFRAFEKDELEFLQHFKSGELIANEGTTFLMEGTSSPHLFTVLSGWAFRYKLLPDGRRQILNFALPGDFLGLQTTLFGEMQHSVQALTPLRLCVFPREKLWLLYEKYPALAFDMTWLVARSERLLDDNILAIGQLTAIERIAYVLLHLFHRARELALTDGKRLALPVTQQHIADSLGLSLVHTNKTLKVLAERRCIRWKDGILELLDEKKIAEIGNYDAEASRQRPLL